MMRSLLMKATPVLVRRCAVLAGALLVLALAVGSPQAATAQDTVVLRSGCTNVVLAHPAGTPLRTVVATVQPAGVVSSIFRYDTTAGRFVAFSPSAPDAANDYAVTATSLDAVFICVTVDATLNRGGPALSAAPPPALVTLGVVSAPREITRGEVVTVLIGTLPNYVCTGGVNIPIESVFRFVPIEVTASSSGTAIIRFETFPSDNRGFAYLAVRCADGQLIRVEMRVV